MKLELKPFTELVDAAVEPTRASLRWLWPAALPLAVIGVILIVAQTSFYGDMTDGEFADSLWTAMSGVFLSIFLMFAWLLVASSALSTAALDRLLGRETSFWSALAWVLSPRVFGTLLGMAICLAVGFGLCFLPGLIVLPLFGLVIPVMRLEGRFGLEAYRRSFALVWFNNSGRLADSGWLFMWGIIFITWMLSTALASVVTLPLMIYQQWVTFDQAFSGSGVDQGAILREMQPANILAQIVGAFAQATAWLYAGYASALFYFESRRRREAYDLEQAIEALNASHDVLGANAIQPAALPD